MLEVEVVVHEGTRRGGGGPITAADPPSRRVGCRRIVDPVVSTMKFEWELGHFVDAERQHRRNGILLLRAAFPEILLAFANACPSGARLAFGAILDYTDYDYSPPTVTLVDPFTEQPLALSELPRLLTRRVVSLAVDPAKRSPLVPLVQPRGESPPCLLLPGTRPYHEHPAMSRNSWLLARTRDGGSLTSLAVQLAACASSAIEGNGADPAAGPGTPAHQNGHFSRTRDVGPVA